LLLGVLGGTGIGGFMAGHTGLVYGIAAGYFVLGLAGGWYLWSRKKSASNGLACRMDWWKELGKDEHQSALPVGN
jgi:hypothetical protein